MNGTVIDIPGISVNVNRVSLEHSTDKASVIELKDVDGKTVTVTVCFGRITDLNVK